MDKIRLTEVIRAIGIKGKLKVTKGMNKENISICCPLAKWRHEKGSDSRPSMSISFNDKGEPSLVHCFSCHFNGTLLSLLQAMSTYRGGDTTLDTLIKQVEKNDKITATTKLDNFQRGLFDEIAKTDEQLLAGNTKSFQWDDKELDRFKITKLPEYAIRRGFTSAMAKLWELGYDRKRHRLTFPIRDDKHNLVGLMGRDIHPDPKIKWFAYWNCPKGFYLYGEHLLDKSAEFIIVCEGMLDVIHLYSLGIKNPICIFGSYITEHQIQRLLRYGLPIIAFFDGDEGGTLASNRLNKMVEGAEMVLSVDMPDGKDPGDLTKEEIDTLISNRKLYKFKNLELDKLVNVNIIDQLF